MNSETGQIYSPTEFQALPETEKKKCVEISTETALKLSPHSTAFKKKFMKYFQQTGSESQALRLARAR